MLFTLLLGWLNIIWWKNWCLYIVASCTWLYGNSLLPASAFVSWWSICKQWPQKPQASKSIQPNLDPYMPNVALHPRTQAFSLQGETDKKNLLEPPHKIVINNKRVLSTKCNNLTKPNKRVFACQVHQTAKYHQVQWLDHKGMYQNLTYLI